MTRITGLAEKKKKKKECIGQSRKIIVAANTIVHVAYLYNSGSDSRNLIGQLQVSKRGRNLERDSKCASGGILSAPGTYLLHNMYVSNSCVAR